jgi:hypothetical protein
MLTSISRSNIIFGTPLAILAAFSVFFLLHPFFGQNWNMRQSIQPHCDVPKPFLTFFCEYLLAVVPSGEFFNSMHS